MTSPSTPTPMCTPVREALSARFDGEPMPMSLEEVRRHLAGCADCTAYEPQLASVARKVREAGGAPVPDLTAPILVALADEREATATDRRLLELRWLVGLAGIVQLALAMPALMGLVSPDIHVGRDLGALQLALGVGLIFAAWQPRRSIGVLPIAAVVAIASVVSVGVDVATGQAAFAAELTHLSEIVGVVALWALRRRVPNEPTVAASVAG